MLIEKLVRCLIILMFAMAPSARAEIVAVDSLDQIRKDFVEKYNKDYYPQNMLVVLSMEGIIFKSLAAEPSDADSFVKRFAGVYSKIKPASRASYMNDVLFLYYNPGLANKDLPSFIKAISAGGTPVIATTDGLTGNFDNIPKLEIFRADYLKKLDINFEKSFPNNNYIIFNNLGSFENTYPVFYKGILNSNNTSEASLILNFLIQVKFAPQVLVMISSDSDILQSTEIQIKNYSKNIEFIGYHYASVPPKESADEMLKLYQAVVDKVSKVKRNNPVSKPTVQVGNK